MVAEYRDPETAKIATAEQLDFNFGIFIPA
jgi:hypothetical protein